MVTWKAHDYFCQFPYMYDDNVHVWWWWLNCAVWCPGLVENMGATSFCETVVRGDQIGVILLCLVVWVYSVVYRCVFPVLFLVLFVGTFAKKIRCEHAVIISIVSKCFPYEDQIEELFIVMVSVCVFPTGCVFNFLINFDCFYTATYFRRRA